MQALGNQHTDEKPQQASRHEEFLQPVRGGLSPGKNDEVPDRFH